MSNRRVIILMLLGILALAGLEFWLSRREEVRLLPRHASLVELDAPIEEITIVRKGTPPVMLKYGKDWQIVAPYRGNVHSPAVLKLIDALTLTAVSDRLNDTELAKIGRDHADFSLTEPHLKVTLKTSTGVSATVSFGVPTPTADGVYAAVSGTEAVFIVSTAVFGAADVTAEGLRLRELFQLKPDSVREISFRRGGQQPVVFQRDEQGWHCEKHTASAAKLRQYLETLTAAQAQSFIWPVGATNEPERAAESLLSGYGLDSENAVAVTLKGVDGREQRLALGKEAAAGSVYALAQEGTVVVTVPTELMSESAQDPARFTDLRLFPVESATVSAFTLVDGETAYTLVRGENDSWRIESPIVAAANAEEVKSLLERLVKLTAADADPQGLAVSLSAKATPVKVAAAAVLPQAGLAALRSLKVLNLDVTAIKRIVRTEAGKEPVSVLYSRERKVWNVEKPEGRGTADAEAIAKVVKSLTELSAQQVVKLKVTAADLDDYGLDKPFLTIAIDQDREGAVRRNLILGDAIRGGRYATVGSTDAVFVLSEEQTQRIVLPLVNGL